MGPQSATDATKALIPHEAVLEFYQVQRGDGGHHAQAEVSVRLADRVPTPERAADARPM